MILEAFALAEQPQALVPVPPARDWMDTGTARYAYRCLPVAVANTYGWQLLLPVDMTAQWIGGPDLADVTAACERPH